MMRAARRVALLVVLLLASVGTASAESPWVLWTETTEFVEPVDMGGVLRGDGFRGKKSWQRDNLAYDTLAACEEEIPRRLITRVESYRSMGFTITHPDEDGGEKFVRSGLPHSRWCDARACVIAGSAGRSSSDGRERLTDHRLYCLPSTINPRGPKGE